MTTATPVALVTGGSRGLGMAIVKALLDIGLRTATVSRKPTPEIEVLLTKHPGRLAMYPGDLGAPDQLGALIRRIEHEFGPIGYLVNNAGVALEGFLARLPSEQIRNVIDINVRGTLELTRAVTRGMMVRRFGRIVTISSIVAVQGFTGTAPYAASKGALEAMTRALARELGGRNITVNAVAPGYMETEMTENLSAEQRRQILRRTPLGRVATVDDVAGVVRFLMSDEARFISGQTIVVDGGLTA
jgi:3-oxoacyl-[acyl-carrier protein] reductase